MDCEPTKCQRFLKFNPKEIEMLIDALSSVTYNLKDEWREMRRDLLKRLKNE